jgi:hypothetical protein
MSDLPESRSETWHRRHALNLAAQLPQDPDDALIVLECARDFVERFIADTPPPSSGSRVLYLAHKGDRIMSEDFQAAYADYLIAKADLAGAEKRKADEKEYLAHMEMVRDATWRLIRTPAQNLGDIRLRARVVSDLYHYAAEAGSSTDNSDRLMLAALVTEIAQYSGDQ